MLTDFKDSCAHFVFGLFFEAVDLHRCRDDGDLIRLKEVLYLAAKNSGFDWVWLALPPGSVCVCVAVGHRNGTVCDFPGRSSGCSARHRSEGSTEQPPGQQSQLPQGYLASRSCAHI